MVSFSRFIDGQLGLNYFWTGFLYSRRKDRDIPTSSTWRCQKYRTKKCPSTVLLNTADETLTSGEKPHTHKPGNWEAEKADFRQSLKRKAADEHLSATQNLLTEALVNCNSELNVELPKIESLAKVVQRSLAKSNGLANYSEASLSTDFILPPTCLRSGVLSSDSGATSDDRFSSGPSCCGTYSLQAA